MTETSHNMNPISVTFDSNVWEKIVTPESAFGDENAVYFATIRSLLEKRQARGYLSEVIFNLEAVPKRLRWQYFGNYQPKSEYTNLKTSDNSVHGRVAIKPNPVGHPGNSEFLDRHLKNAKNLGLTLISSPRIGLPRSPDLPGALFKVLSAEELKAQQHLYFEAGHFITELGCGISLVKELGERYKKSANDTWLSALSNTPESKKKKVAKAIAEWADGDAVAAHISYRLDYFCTLDKAAGAGRKSIFSSENRKKLIEKYQTKFVTPKEFCDIYTE